MRDTRLLPISEPGAIGLAADILRSGGLVAFPTETVYGLGADACNPLAVAGIFEAKERPAFDPLIVHVPEPAAAGRYGDLDSPAARRLAERFWPGPLTIVVRRRPIVPPIVTSGLDTVGLRCPAHTAARALLRAAGLALAAPSANIFGRISPTRAAHVAEQLWGRIDLILDGGACTVGVESTIIALGPPTLLRSGGTPVEEIEALLGPLARATHASGRPLSPGQEPAHYAPRTPLSIEAAAPRPRSGERIGLLALRPPPHPEGFAAVEVLSERGDLREAAARLFAALHRLDHLGLDRLVALPLPESGLGLAIMDRLRRAAAASGA